MLRRVYRFSFEPDVSMDDVQQSLVLATIAIESIYGERALEMDGRFAVRRKRRSCLIDAETPLGCDLAKAFGGFLTTVAHDSYRVEMQQTREPLGDQIDLCEAFL